MTTHDGAPSESSVPSGRAAGGPRLGAVRAHLVGRGRRPGRGQCGRGRQRPPQAPPPGAPVRTADGVRPCHVRAFAARRLRKLGVNLLGQVLAEYLADVAAALTVTAAAWLVRKRRSRQTGLGEGDST